MKTLVSEIQPTLDEWHQIVSELEDEITHWCENESWIVTRTEAHVIDARPQFGIYDIPSLSIETPDYENRLIVEPMAHAFDGTGTVRLYAWPTLYRVRLLYRGGTAKWEILTDSRVPLHEDWNQATFIRLAHDLLKADY